MPVWKDFKEFAVKGNMVDLAVGVIIGAAFGGIINSIVQDVTMPLLNPLMPQGHWRDLVGRRRLGPYGPTAHGYPGRNARTPEGTRGAVRGSARALIRAG